MFSANHRVIATTPTHFIAVISEKFKSDNQARNTISRTTSRAVEIFFINIRWMWYTYFIKESGGANTTFPRLFFGLSASAF